jgi:hypothetical protein
VEYTSYPCRRKVKILLFKSKWDTLSILNIENEKYFVSKNRGAAPLILIQMLENSHLYTGNLTQFLYELIHDNTYRQHQQMAPKKFSGPIRST